MGCRPLSLSQRLPSWRHCPCQHGTGTLPSLAQADIQVMPIRAFGISTLISRYSKALPAGAAHAVPDSQPTEEDPGKHSQTSMLPSQQSDVHKQQRPLALLRAAAAKRALDRDAAGSRAGPMKQPRSSDARPCRSEHSVATPGQLAWLAAHIAGGIVAVYVSPKTVVSLCDLKHMAVLICSREKTGHKARHEAGAELGCDWGPGCRTAP